MVWQIEIFTVGWRHDVNQTPENDQAGQLKNLQYMFLQINCGLQYPCKILDHYVATCPHLSFAEHCIFIEQFKAINTQLALEMRIVGEIVPNILPCKKLNAEFVRHECTKQVTPVQKAGWGHIMM